jgi:hypothetical protein
LTQDLAENEGFEWTTGSEKAAWLLAEGRLSDDKIAEAAKVSRSRLARWKLHPEFVARVASLVDEYRQLIRRLGLSILERRVASLNDRWNRLRRIMDERSVDPSMKGVPGGTTGLLVRQLKGLGSGDTFQVVEEYAIDTTLLRELREHERQAAQELGQWVERQQFAADPDNLPVVKVLKDISMDEL